MLTRHGLGSSSGLRNILLSASIPSSTHKFHPSPVHTHILTSPFSSPPHSHPTPPSNHRFRGQHQGRAALCQRRQARDHAPPAEQRGGQPHPAALHGRGD
jgi:hypothetical protein